MLDTVVKWGDSIEAAVKLALNDLKLSEDEVDVEVLEQPTRGFLGFHKKLAKVRVTKKPEQEPAAKPEIITEEPAYEPVQEPVDAVRTQFKPAEENEAEAEEIRESVTAEKSSAEEEFQDDEDEKPAAVFFEEEQEEVLKPVRRRKNDRRRNNAPVYMNTKFSISEEDTEAVPADDSFAVTFLKKIISQMGLGSVEVTGSLLDDVLYISLSGEEVGALIGKRGRTLDSLQYLASIVQNKNSENYTRVLINAENYREKREKTLQQFARKVADKCARSGRNQRLEPMNPYERKVIHSTLQSDPRVMTRSEGAEPSRRVVIEVKK